MYVFYLQGKFGRANFSQANVTPAKLMLPYLVLNCRILSKGKEIYLKLGYFHFNTNNVQVIVTEFLFQNNWIFSFQRKQNLISFKNISIFLF